MSLTFLDSLDAEQLKHARKVGERAKAMGIDPALAISIAYQESRLKPNVSDSPAGAVGLMQVMPASAAAFGIKQDKLRNVDTNLETGLKILKQALQNTGNDPVRAVISYNAGPGTLQAYETGEKELPNETKNYITSLHGYGTFGDRELPASVSAEPPAPPDTGEKPAGMMDKAKDAVTQAMQGLGVGEPEIGGLMGLGAGYLERKGAGPGSISQDFLKAIRQPPQGVPPPEAPSPLSQAARIHQGTVGDQGTTGRQRMAGFNEPTAQTAARQKSMDEILNRLRQQGTIASTPSQVFAQAADVTATPSGVLYPKGVVLPDLTPAPQPPKLSPLDEAKRTLQGLMQRGSEITKGVANVAKAFPMVSYPLAGYGAGMGLQEMREELQKDRPDWTDVALTGAGALGTLGALSTTAAPVAVPLAIGAPLVRYLRSKREPLGPVPAERQIPGLSEVPRETPEFAPGRFFSP